MKFVEVINEEEQYSVWPAAKELPLGWFSTGFEGERDECLAHIALVWTNIQPKSSRRADS